MRKPTTVRSTPRRNRLWSLLIGFGMVLFPIHNPALTGVSESTGISLPALGAAVWIMATLLYLADNYKSITWGKKEVYIPLLVIAGAMALSGIPEATLGAKTAPALMGITLFCLYLVSRKLGKDLFIPLALGAAVAAAGIIAYGLLHPGVASGGYVFGSNFDIATGFVLLGAALCIGRWRAPLALLAVVAMVFSGGPEALFGLGVLAVVVLLRKDWSKKLLWLTGVVVFVGGVLLVTGDLQRLYSKTVSIAKQEPIAQYVELDGTPAPTNPVMIRVLVIRDALETFRPLGEGYSLTEFTIRTVHNVPLIIVQQLGWPGVLAALAWLWMMIWGLRKTKWKYVFVLILALSIWDHYFWDQLIPFWWAAVGVASAGVGTDLVFRNERIGEDRKNEAV